MDRITAFRGEYAFLSNFHPCPVRLDGEVYRTVEHAYHAAKTLDPAERACIRRSATAAQAKRWGRRVTLRTDWETLKIAVMRDLLQQKFFNGSVLWYKLMATTGKDLVEGNTWGDRYWGCTAAPRAIPASPIQWVGENHLGNLLMQIRDAR